MGGWVGSLGLMRLSGRFEGSWLAERYLLSAGLRSMLVLLKKVGADMEDPGCI